MQKLQEEHVFRQNKYSRLFIAVLVLVVVGLSALRVFVANRLVETSENLRHLDTQVNQLEEENKLLAGDLRLLEATDFVARQVSLASFVPTRHYSFAASAPMVARNNINGPRLQ